jgi:mRNA-degrading endonuclease RelE of RelBE toxin-antitoxin system
MVGEVNENAACSAKSLFNSHLVEFTGIGTSRKVAVVLPFREYDLHKLKGTANFFRLRIGKLRVIYEIEGQIIYVHHVGFRESAYE